jgi:hypothetical protein
LGKRAVREGNRFAAARLRATAPLFTGTRFCDTRIKDGEGAPAT